MTKFDRYRFKKLGEKFDKMSVKIDEYFLKEREAIEKKDHESFVYYSNKINKLLGKRRIIIEKRRKLLLK